MMPTMNRYSKRFIQQWLTALGVGCSMLLSPLVAQAQTSADDAKVALGQRIYREGTGASGEPIRAIGAAQTMLSGKTVACVACHRRSGFGTTEGPFNIRPITGPALFEDQTVVVRSPRIKAQLGSRLRPAYTEPLLAKAIGTGIDSSGQPLDAVMPRYALTTEEMKAISAYLATLDNKPSPGVDEEEIHFATVFQPGVAPERRRAMLDTLQAFFRDKGANVRQDEQRRDAGNMRMYRSYRKWVLHVWELKGDSETWTAQLESLYRQRPVFAMVAGLGTQKWDPIHNFSERFEVPAVFAQTDLPVVGGNGNYNFYFSRGAVLDAEVLAKFLRQSEGSKKVVQVFRHDDAGLAASLAFKNAVQAGTTVEDRVLTGTADESFWRTVYSTKPDSIALWLGQADVVAVPFADEMVGIPLYASLDLLGGKPPPGLAKLNARLIYPSDLSPKHEARLLRTKIWLHSKKIPITDETLQVNTQFAVSVLNDAVGHIMDSFSRDYLVERIEHIVGQTPIPSSFPSVSLGPEQRFAAKGRAIVQLGGDEKMPMTALTGWLIP